MPGSTRVNIKHFDELNNIQIDSIQELELRIYGSANKIFSPISFPSLRSFTLNFNDYLDCNSKNPEGLRELFRCISAVAAISPKLTKIIFNYSRDMCMSLDTWTEAIQTLSEQFLETNKTIKELIFLDFRTTEEKSRNERYLFNSKIEKLLLRNKGFSKEGFIASHKELMEITANQDDSKLSEIKSRLEEIKDFLLHNAEIEEIHEITLYLNSFDPEEAMNFVQQCLTIREQELTVAQCGILHSGIAHILLNTTQFKSDTSLETRLKIIEHLLYTDDRVLLSCFINEYVTGSGISRAADIKNFDAELDHKLTQSEVNISIAFIKTRRELFFATHKPTTNIATQTQKEDSWKDKLLKKGRALLCRLGC